MTKYILNSMLFYGIVECIIYLTSQHLSDKDIRICLLQGIVILLISFIVQCITRRELFSKYNIVPMIVGCLFGIIEPTLNWYSNWYVPVVKNNFIDDALTYYINSKSSVQLGVYLTLFFSLLKKSISLINKKYLCTFGGVLTCLCLTIPIIDIVHYFIYGVNLNVASIKVVQLTSPREALEYILSHVGIGIVFAVVAFVILFFIFARIDYKTTKHSNLDSNKILNIATIVMLFHVGILFTKDVKLIQYWEDASYQIEIERNFYVNYQDKYDSILVDKLDVNSETTTIIVVIGESESRDFMHYYNPSYRYANTPWLESVHHNDNFYILDNGYSCFNQTVEVLKRALTECSQYNDIELQDAVSIIDIAKKAGYNTYWYSSADDSGAVTTLIAQACDTFEILPNQGGDKHDKTLVERLQDIPLTENNLVFIHLLGSHDSYKSRYPTDWKKWNDDDNEGAYANSILYTDEVLQDIYNYGITKMNMDVMIYFSDHGENIEYGHHPSKPSLDTFRIPIFIAVSSRYQERYPEKNNALINNKQKYYSNDMMFNTILGIAGIKTNKYNPKEDLSSIYYTFSRDEIKIQDGKVRP